MHISVTEAAGREFVTRGVTGPVFMLNLLKFREQADYSENPELAPDEPISGQEAYHLYMDQVEPMLEAVGGKLALIGDGGTYLIGPPDEAWDLVLLVRHAGVNEFLAFASNEDYKAIAGHRAAALADSRLLPIVER